MGNRRSIPHFLEVFVYGVLNSIFRRLEEQKADLYETAETEKLPAPTTHDFLNLLGLNIRE